MEFTPLSRDGNGNWSSPIAPFVYDTVISETDVNTLVTDIGAGLTQSLSKDGQTVPTANLPMGGYKHTGVANGSSRTDYAAVGQVQDSAFQWGGTAGGTADALTISLTPAITAYAANQTFRFIAGASPNTGPATIAVSGLAAKAIQNDGAALAAGDIAAGKLYQVTYDGTAFQLARIRLSVADEKVKVSSNDTTPGYLNGKLVVGSGVTFTEGSDGGNETLTIAAITGARNKIINGDFRINQRSVSGTVTLASGVYGHDRWKAGASGCTYTFATSNGVTTLTITAGSLQQVIEGANLRSGTHCLSWTGTAQGKIGAGSYSASGVTGAATGGSNLTIEFGTGTLSDVQLEAGSTATTLEQRLVQIELALCQRYYWKSFPDSVAPAQNAGTSGSIVLPQIVGASTTQNGITIALPVPMRAANTLTLYNPSAANAQVRNTSTNTDCSSSAIAITSSTNCWGFHISLVTPAASAAGNQLRVHATIEGEL